jgi:hypothetical protein
MTAPRTPAMTNLNDVRDDSVFGGRKLQVLARRGYWDESDSPNRTTSRKLFPDELELPSGPVERHL